MTQRTQFITLEGIEGSGKSTQARRLRDDLASRNLPILLTREPGGTDIGAKIRAIVLDPAHDHLAPLAELLLYCADRAQHTATTIRPSLEAGSHVLCDRYCDASRAYQGHARKLGIDLVDRLDVGRRLPDLTLLFDLPAELGLRRARERNRREQLHAESRFEDEELAFHGRVRAGYLDLARREPARFHIVDAARSEDVVFEEVLAAVNRRLT